jgi:hypothetical protein
MAKGDYYAGGRGDPGIGSFFSSLARGAGAMIKSFVGLPSAGGAGAITRVIPKAATAGRAIIARGGQIIRQHPALSAAGAAGVIAAGGVAVGRMGRAGVAPEDFGGVVPRGWHISRKTGNVVKNRHMNVCNPRALRRSLRRAHGFAKFAMKTIHLVHPKKKGRFGGFRKRKRK